MIAYACCVGSRATFARCAAPGLRRAMEPDSVLAEVTTEHSIHEAYNEVLAHFAGADDLEALVLLHEDTELLDPGFAEHVRRVLADPGVAIAGVVGARGVHRLEWWAGPVVGRLDETRGTVVGVAPAGDVDALDGLLLVLSPWAVRELRCDTATFTGFHAYDVDLCLQARAAGRRVVAHPFAVFHHATTGKDRLDEGFMAADAALRRKWGLAPA
jgi:GT2 family glycosyltransferase